MLLWFRKILFYVFILLYFFLTPYVILYAFGYIFSPIEKSLVKTGLVSVITEPRSATVFVHGKKYAHRTPTTVADLLPGRYSIRITRKGFESWEKEITIYPEKAVQLEPVILLPYRPERQEIVPRPFKGMSPRIHEGKILAWENETLDSLWKIDLLFKKETPAARGAGGSGIKIRDLHYQSDSPLVLLETEGGEKTPGFWILDPGAERKELRSLTDLIQGRPEAIDWDPKHPDFLYVLEHGVLGRVDARRAGADPNLLSGVLGFGVRGRHLMILKKDYTLVETDPQGKQGEPLVENPMLGANIFADLTARFFRIKILEDNLFVFLSDEGALVTNRMPYHFVDEGVRGIDYSDRFLDTSRMLYWTAKEIGVIDFSRSKGSVFERGPEKKVIYEEGRDIRQAVFVYDDSHVVFADGRDLLLLETKGPAPYLARLLDHVASGTYVAYSGWDDSLFFLDASSRRLVKRKLVD